MPYVEAIAWLKENGYKKEDGTFYEVFKNSKLHSIVWDQPNDLKIHVRLFLSFCFSVEQVMVRNRLHEFQTYFTLKENLL